MFKSKPCNTHLQWQHDINPSLMSTGFHRAPYTSVPGCEERSPEPKPRWNPKPEQIRILEAIFNSGMVNPPRDEIRKIRAQLQEYGQVGDANVFYWFQNRKSRSKHKQRHLNSAAKSNPNNLPPPPSPLTAAPSSSSSSSSDKSSPNGSNFNFSNSPTASVNQTYFQTSSDLLPENYLFPVTQGLCFGELSNNIIQLPDQTCSGFLFTDLMNHGVLKKDEEEKMKLHHQLSYTVTSPLAFNNNDVVPSTATTIALSSPLPDTINQTQIQGVAESGAVGPASAAKSTVFINDVAFEVSVGPFNVREAFGGDAVLINSSGQPVLTNEWGVTLQSLQHGAFYYLI